MIRHSSFFWASDDLHLHGDGDATDEPTVDSCSPHLATCDQETVEINPLNWNTYGALFVDNATVDKARSASIDTRRKLFDLSSGDGK